MERSAVRGQTGNQDSWEYQASLELLVSQDLMGQLEILDSEDALAIAACQVPLVMMVNG